MSENTSNSNELKRLDVVNYLLQEKNLKPSKSNKNYATEYVNYLCSKLSVERSAVPNVYKDISQIKKFYVECAYNIPFMIESHKNFFNTVIKPIIPDPEPTTSDTVCFKSHKILY